MAQEPQRIQVQDDDGENTGRWFDPAKATKYEEDTRWNGSNHISLATGSQWEHEELYRTATGQWVVHHWSQWQGSTPHHQVIGPAEAAAWLIRNGHEPPEALAEYVRESEV